MGVYCSSCNVRDQVAKPLIRKNPNCQEKLVMWIQYLLTGVDPEKEYKPEKKKVTATKECSTYEKYWIEAEKKLEKQRRNSTVTRRRGSKPFAFTAKPKKDCVYQKYWAMNDIMIQRRRSLS